MREKIFSVGISDCRVDYFASGGTGGQRKNKVKSSVRIVHVPSGALVTATEQREQLQNKRMAFKRLTEHPLFQCWIQREADKIMNKRPSIDELVDEQMKEENLLIE